MTIWGSGQWVIIGLASAAAACSTQSPGDGTGSGGSAATTGGNTAAGQGGNAAGGAALGGGGVGGGAAGGSATGGNATGGGGGAAQPMTQIRFMQVYLNGGTKKTYDLWARKNDRSWVSLVRNLKYGELTGYLDVPIGAGRNTMIWYIPPGDDPEKYAISIGSFINHPLDDTETGRHTSFMFHVPGVEDWAVQLLTDGDPELTPPAGYAYVAFNTDAIRPIHPVMDYGETAACIARAEQASYQPIAAGTHAFALYSGASAANCQGSVIATAPSTAFGDREVWFLYALGDAANGFELRPVKLTRP